MREEEIDDETMKEKNIFLSYRGIQFENVEFGAYLNIDLISHNPNNDADKIIQKTKIISNLFFSGNGEIPLFEMLQMADVRLQIPLNSQLSIKITEQKF